MSSATLFYMHGDNSRLSPKCRHHPQTFIPSRIGSILLRLFIFVFIVSSSFVVEVSSTTIQTPIIELQNTTPLHQQVNIQEAPPSPRKPHKLRLIHFNDVYQVNQLRQEGGFAHLKTMIKRLKAEAEAEGYTALTMFSGDFLPASFGTIPLDPKLMLTFLDALDIDFATIGNHDIDVPNMKEMRDLLLSTNMKFITTNVLWKEQNQTAVYFGGNRFATVNVGSWRVGIVGVLTKSTLKESPRISREKRLRITDEITSIKAATKELYEKFKCDAVIVLSHLSYKEDIALARAVSGLTTVLGGHDHYPITVLEGGTQEGTLISKSGMNGQHLAAIDLSFEPARLHHSTPRIFKEWRLLNSHFYPPDLEYTKMLEDYHSSMLDESPVIGKTLTLLDSLAENVRRKETTMGNLVCDVLRDRTRSDVCIIPGGSLRGNRVLFPSTELRESTILSEFPFHNHVVTVQLTAPELYDVLEHGLTAIDFKGSGRFPQVSGVRLVYDPQAPSGRRIITLESDLGEEIPRANNSTQTFTLAIPDFCYHGGDGYGFLSQKPIESEKRELISSMVIDWIKQKQIVAPTLEGRILEVRGNYRRKESKKEL